MKAQCIGKLDYAVYTARACATWDPSRLPWLTYDEAMSHLPQARWIARVSRRRADAVSGLRIHDAESAIAALLAVPTKTLLPVAIAERESGLKRLATDDEVASLTREAWLLTHTDQSELKRVKAVASWIRALPLFASA